MNEISINQCNSASIVVVKTNVHGRKVIQKSQRIRILKNILSMSATYSLPFNRLLCLEARFHGLSKERLCDQLSEVYSSLREDHNFSGSQGLENLEKEVLSNSITKMKPNALDLGENILHQCGTARKESSSMKELLDENSSSLKSQECKSSNSSLSSTSKNGGRKRKLKESRKKVKERGQRSKRQRQSSSSAEDTLNSPSQEIPVKSKLEESPCSVKDILQSKMHHREINQT